MKIALLSATEKDPRREALRAVALYLLQHGAAAVYVDAAAEKAFSTEPLQPCFLPAEELYGAGDVLLVLRRPAVSQIITSVPRAFAAGQPQFSASISGASVSWRRRRGSKPSFWMRFCAVNIPCRSGSCFGRKSHMRTARPIRKRRVP